MGIPTHDKSPTMRSSSLVSVLWTWALSGLLITTAAADVLATFTPCPECPQSVMPAPITITAQYQPVSTCTPTTTCSAVEMSSASITYTTSQCQVQPSCTTYDWVSTTIPYLGGASSTVITGTDQVVELARVSTVFTTYSPCATAAPTISNGTTNSLAFRRFSRHTPLVQLQRRLSRTAQRTRSRFDGFHDILPLCNCSADYLERHNE